MADKNLSQAVAVSTGVLTTLGLTDTPNTWTLSEMSDYVATFKDDLGTDTVGGAYVRPSVSVEGGKHRLVWEVSLTPFVEV